jgi:integrase
MEISDSSCLGLEFRITKTGKRSWSYRYRAPITGRDLRVTIGPYPAIGLQKARQEADVLRAAVARGENPAIDKRQARAEAPGRTFGALADRYLTEYARREKRSANQDELNLRLHVLPKWRDRDYLKIRRRDVIELIEGLITEGKETLANRMQSLVSGIFSFPVDSDLREDNPCMRLKKRGTERAGSRVLSDGEIRLFWRRIVLPPVSHETGLALRALLITGVRPGEAAQPWRSEVQQLDDDAEALWTVPGSKAKNGNAHVVPLVGLARISSGRKVRIGNRTTGRYFPAAETRTGP